MRPTTACSRAPPRRPAAWEKGRAGDLLPPLNTAAPPMGPGGRAMTCGGWPGAAAADPHDAGRSAVARSVPAPGSPNSPTMCRSAGRAVAGRPRGAAVPGCPAPSHRRRRHAAEPLRHQHRWHARRSPPCKCATGRRSGRGPHPRHQRAQPSPPRRQAESNLARKRPDRPLLLTWVPIPAPTGCARLRAPRRLPLRRFSTPAHLVTTASSDSPGTGPGPN